MIRSVAVAWLAVFVSSSWAIGADLEPAADAALECGVASEVVYAVQASVGRGEILETDGAGLLSVLTTACHEGLFLNALEAKLSEGLAKRVPPSRMLAALEHQLAPYRQARALAGGNEDADPQLEALIGEGLVAGVPAELFEQYMARQEGLDPESFLVGVEMLSLVSQAGVAPELVDAVSSAVFRAGSVSSEWRYLVQTVLIARHRGIDDAAVIGAAAEVLENRGSPADVAARFGFTLRKMSGAMR